MENYHVLLLKKDPSYTDTKEDLKTIFFDMGQTKDKLEQTGVVYHPSGEWHCWGTNLSWLIAHIRRGNVFMARAGIFSGRYRVNAEEDDARHSAFIREFCAVIKAGYILCLSRERVMLLPSEFAALQNVDSTGDPGNGINPSDEEINTILVDLLAQMLHHCKVAREILIESLKPMEDLTRKLQIKLRQEKIANLDVMLNRLLTNMQELDVNDLEKCSKHFIQIITELHALYNILLYKAITVEESILFLVRDLKEAEKQSVAMVDNELTIAIKKRDFKYHCKLFALGTEPTIGLTGGNDGSASSASADGSRQRPKRSSY